MDEPASTESEPSTFALGVTGAVVFTVASYVTATLLYAIIGKQGIPLSPLLAFVPFVPAYMFIVRIDQRLEAGTKAKDRLTFIGCFAPLIISIVLVLVAPLTVMEGTFPRFGAFGLTLTVCIVIGIALIARGQWVNRDKS